MKKSDNSDPVLQVISQRRALTSRQIKRLGLRRHECLPVVAHLCEVYDRAIWLEMVVGRGWRAAYRLVSQSIRGRRRLVVGEIRILPIEAGEDPGEWSGSRLSERARLPVGGLPITIARQALT